MILNKLQRVWLSVVRLPPTAEFIEIEGYKVVAIQFQLFYVSLHDMVSLEHYLPL